MIRWLQAILVLATLITLERSAASAHADLVLYDNEADYLAASAGVVRIGFDGIVPPFAFESLATPPGLTLSGVNFTIDHTNNDGSLFVAGEGFYYSQAALTSQQSATGPNNLVITLPGGFTSVAVDFGSFFGSTFTLSLSTGEAFTRSSSVFPGLNFVGFTSDTPVTTVRIEAPTSDVLNITGLSFGQVIPEPGSLTLAGLGVLCLLAYGRRWQKREAA